MNETGSNMMINIGSKEAPVLVPKKALFPESEDGREWWKMVAVGSVVLGQEELNKLLKMFDEKKT